MEHLMRAISQIIISVLLITSCTLNEFDPTEWAVEPTLELSESGAVISSQDEQYSFSFETNYNEVSVKTDSYDWVYASVDMSDKTIRLEVLPNTGVEQRTASVEVYVSKGQKYLSKVFTLYQVGGEWDIIEGTDIKLRWNYKISESQKEIIKNQIQELVFVKGGTFMMGTQNEDENAPNYFKYDNETNPLHQVTLSDYRIGKYELTQEQWVSLMGENPSRFNGGRKPVENIEWEEAMEYVALLSKLTGLSFSLPTSAQWEYAARGGEYSMGYYYPGSDDYNEVAHIVDYGIPESSFLYCTEEVGSLKPNELGLYDMAGNVSEMCLDWYGEIQKEDQTNPTGPNTGEYHVARGGEFSDGSLIDFSGNCGYPCKCIVTDDSQVGFRIVLNN